MTLHRTLFTTLLASAVAMANPYQSHEEDLASVVETGKKASEKLLQTLGGNLQKQMKAGGPIAAAKFCSSEAFPLTDSVSQELGANVSVKRISLKERNPANAPEGHEKAVLESLQTLKESNVLLPEYLVEEIGNDTYKFYKPLSINKPVCLKCHGQIEDKELAGYIKNIYPTDKATGYKMGDLRGAIVVTVKK